MCGRFTLEPTTEFYERFQIANRLETLVPRYNIAPGQDVPIVLQQSPNRVMLMRWGLIPHWAKEPKIGYKMINARAETLTEKPSYRNLLKSRRCLVPASGFYEWQATKQGKVPYYIHSTTEPFVAFAGLYDAWMNAKEEEIYTFTIITTEPNAVVKSIHNRTPVILRKAEEARWLDQKITEPQEVLPLLRPYEETPLEVYHVSQAVNKPGMDTKALIQKVK